MMISRGRTTPLWLTSFLLGCQSAPQTGTLLDATAPATVAPDDADAGSAPSIPNLPEIALDAGFPMPSLGLVSDTGVPESDAAELDGGGLPKLRFPAVSDFAMPGSFETTSEPTDSDCTVYRPTQLGAGGLRHPVILWGNGTGTPTVEVYAGFFKQWASHGFIVAAANTAFAGSGKEMLACLDWLTKQNASAGSPYAGAVDLENVGASGHSQGGGGTVMVGADPRVKTTIPLQAWTGNSPDAPMAETQQHGPVFLVSGTADVIAPAPLNQQPIFDALTVPTFWGTLNGGDHVTIALGSVDKYLAPTTAWFRLFLMGDESARSMFYGASCALCTNQDWMVQKKMMD